MTVGHLFATAVLTRSLTSNWMSPEPDMSTLPTLLQPSMREFSPQGWWSQLVGLLM